MIHVAIFVAAVMYLSVAAILVEDATTKRDVHGGRWGTLNVAAAVAAMMLSLGGVLRDVGYGFVIDSEPSHMLMKLLAAVAYLATSSKALSLESGTSPVSTTNESRKNWLTINTVVSALLTAYYLNSFVTQVRRI